MHCSRMSTVRFNSNLSVERGGVYPGMSVQGVCAWRRLPRGGLLWVGGRLPGGVCSGGSVQGGVCPGVSAHECLSRGCLPGGTLPSGGVCQGVCACPWGCTPPVPRGRHPPDPEADAPLWTKWHTGVKTLPCPELRLRVVKING